MEKSSSNTDSWDESDEENFENYLIRPPPVNIDQFKEHIVTSNETTDNLNWQVQLGKRKSSTSSSTVLNNRPSENKKNSGNIVNAALKKVKKSRNRRIKTKVKDNLPQIIQAVNNIDINSLWSKGMPQNRVLQEIYRLKAQELRLYEEFQRKGQGQSARRQSTTTQASTSKTAISQNSPKPQPSLGQSTAKATSKSKTNLNPTVKAATASKSSRNSSTSKSALKSKSTVDSATTKATGTSKDSVNPSSTKVTAISKGNLNPNTYKTATKPKTNPSSSTFKNVTSDILQINSYSSKAAAKSNPLISKATTSQPTHNQVVPNLKAANDDQAKKRTSVIATMPQTDGLVSQHLTQNSGNVPVPVTIPNVTSITQTRPNRDQLGNAQYVWKCLTRSSAITKKEPEKTGGPPASKQKNKKTQEPKKEPEKTTVPFASKKQKKSQEPKKEPKKTSGVPPARKNNNKQTQNTLSQYSIQNDPKVKSFLNYLGYNDNRDIPEPVVPNIEQLKFFPTSCDTQVKLQTPKLGNLSNTKNSPAIKISNQFNYPMSSFEDPEAIGMPVVHKKKSPNKKNKNIKVSLKDSSSTSALSSSVNNSKIGFPDFYEYFETNSSDEGDIVTNKSYKPKKLSPTNSSSIYKEPNKQNKNIKGSLKDTSSTSALSSSVNSSKIGFPDFYEYFETNSSDEGDKVTNKSYKPKNLSPTNASSICKEPNKQNENIKSSLKDTSSTSALSSSVNSSKIGFPDFYEYFETNSPDEADKVTNKCFKPKDLSPTNPSSLFAALLAEADELEASLVPMVKKRTRSRGKKKIINRNTLLFNDDYSLNLVSPNNYESTPTHPHFHLGMLEFCVNCPESSFESEGLLTASSEQSKKNQINLAHTVLLDQTHTLTENVNIGTTTGLQNSMTERLIEFERSEQMDELMDRELEMPIFATKESDSQESSEVERQIWIDDIAMNFVKYREKKQNKISTTSKEIKFGKEDKSTEHLDIYATSVYENFQANNSLIETKKKTKRQKKTNQVRDLPQNNTVVDNQNDELLSFSNNVAKPQISTVNTLNIQTLDDLETKKVTLMQENVVQEQGAVKNEFEFPTFIKDEVPTSTDKIQVSANCIDENLVAVNSLVKTKKKKKRPKKKKTIEDPQINTVVDNQDNKDPQINTVVVYSENELLSLNNRDVENLTDTVQNYETMKINNQQTSEAKQFQINTKVSTVNTSNIQNVDNVKAKEVALLQNNGVQEPVTIQEEYRQFAVPTLFIKDEVPTSSDKIVVTANSINENFEVVNYLVETKKKKKRPKKKKVIVDTQIKTVLIQENEVPGSYNHDVDNVTDTVQCYETMTISTEQKPEAQLFQVNTKEHQIASVNISNIQNIDDVKAKEVALLQSNGVQEPVTIQEEYRQFGVATFFIKDEIPTSSNKIVVSANSINDNLEAVNSLVEIKKKKKRPRKKKVIKDPEINTMVDSDENILFGSNHNVAQNATEPAQSHETMKISTVQEIEDPQINTGLNQENELPISNNHDVDNVTDTVQCYETMKVNTMVDSEENLLFSSNINDVENATEPVQSHETMKVNTEQKSDAKGFQVAKKEAPISTFLESKIQHLDGAKEIVLQKNDLDEISIEEEGRQIQLSTLIKEEFSPLNDKSVGLNIHNNVIIKNDEDLKQQIMDEFSKVVQKMSTEFKPSVKIYHQLRKLNMLLDEYTIYENGVKLAGEANRDCKIMFGPNSFYVIKEKHGLLLFELCYDGNMAACKYLDVVELINKPETFTGLPETLTGILKGHKIYLKREPQETLDTFVRQKASAYLFEFDDNASDDIYRNDLVDKKWYLLDPTFTDEMQQKMMVQNFTEFVKLWNQINREFEKLVDKISNVNFSPSAEIYHHLRKLNILLDGHDNKCENTVEIKKEETPDNSRPAQVMFGNNSYYMIKEKYGYLLFELLYNDNMTACNYEDLLELINKPETFTYLPEELIAILKEHKIYRDSLVPKTYEHISSNRINKKKLPLEPFPLPCDSKYITKEKYGCLSFEFLLELENNTPFCNYEQLLDLIERPETFRYLPKELLNILRDYKIWSKRSPVQTLNTLHSRFQLQPKEFDEDVEELNFSKRRRNTVCKASDKDVLNEINSSNADTISEKTKTDTECDQLNAVINNARPEAPQEISLVYEDIENLEYLRNNVEHVLNESYDQYTDLDFYSIQDHEKSCKDVIDDRASTAMSFYSARDDLDYIIDDEDLTFEDKEVEKSVPFAWLNVVTQKESIDTFPKEEDLPLAVGNDSKSLEVTENVLKRDIMAEFLRLSSKLTNDPSFTPSERILWHLQEVNKELES